MVNFFKGTQILYHKNQSNGPCVDISNEFHEDLSYRPDSNTWQNIFRRDDKNSADLSKYTVRLQRL